MNTFGHAILSIALVSLAWAAPVAAAPKTERSLSGTLVTAVAVDVSHPTTVYAATVVDGVFKSTNRGVTWKAVNDGLPLPAEAGVLVADPVNAGVLYYGDTGLFKSDDGGNTWHSLVDAILRDIPPLPSCQDGCDVFVRLLAVHPVNSKLHAVTEPFGIVTSDDGGISWSIVEAPLLSPSALVLDPSSASIFYVTNPEANKSGSVLKTFDGGVTWVPSDEGLPLDFVPAFATVGVHALAIDPQVPATLYVGTERVVDGRLPGIGGVFKSVDGGLHWVASSNGLPSNSRVVELVIDPTNHSNLYAVTSGGLFETLDGGVTWTVLDPTLTDANVTAVVLGSPRGNGSKHSKEVYVGTRNGVVVVRR